MIGSINIYVSGFKFSSVRYPSMRFISMDVYSHQPLPAGQGPPAGPLGRTGQLHMGRTSCSCLPEWLGGCKVRAPVAAAAGGRLEGKGGGLATGPQPGLQGREGSGTGVVRRRSPGGGSGQARRTAWPGLFADAQ